MKAAFFVILAGLALAHAARMPELSMVEEDLPESVVAFQGASPLQHVEVEQDDTPLALGEFSTSSLYSALEDILTEPEVVDKKKWPIRIATKHLVKPDLHGNFVRQFWRFQDKSKDIKGVKYIGLSKVAGDNIVWTSWAVYEDFGALIKHAKSEGLRDFASYLTNVNIAVSTKLVFRIAGGYYGQSNTAIDTAATATETGVAPSELGKKKGWPVRLLAFYAVRPGEHSGFIKAWKKMEAKVGGSKGLVSLTLDKPAGNNLLFTSYAHFESASDLWSLSEEKAVRKFLEYVSDNGIVVSTKKLWKIPEPKW